MIILQTLISILIIISMYGKVELLQQDIIPELVMEMFHGVCFPHLEAAHACEDIMRENIETRGKWILP